MFELNGKFNNAKVFTDNIEQEAISQIINMLNQEAFADSKVRIMPDVHAGKGCTIGTTMTIKDKVVPNLVGVDIGCGMEVSYLGKIDIDFEKLDKVINEYIPSGFDVRDKVHALGSEISLEDLRCYHNIDAIRAYNSIGTLGGGNHFIEVDVNDNGEYYLVIHSGSRHLGAEVARYYQEKAYNELTSNKIEIAEIIEQLKKEGRASEIQQTIQNMKKPVINKDFAYCEGSLFDDYIHDMRITQKFAVLNRKAMRDEILTHMNIEELDGFTTIHNYIDLDNMILRKGSVSAQKGEKLIIPINMRDGSLICTGKGNADWNYSAPHGAGRLMSRSAAKANITLDEFKESMEGIYTTSVNTSTIDESPMAYKPIEDIVNNITDTVEINEIIKPVYNFKASA